MPIIKNNAVIVDSCQQRLTALMANVPAKAEITMNGVRYTRTQLAAIFQASLDSRSSLVKSRAQVKVDLATRKKAETSRTSIEPGLKAWVVGQFGAESNEAYEFGYTPHKPGQRSAETKANAVKLAKATRTARSTMGKKQKKSIKGTLDVPAAPENPAPAGAALVTSAVQANGAPAAGAPSTTAAAPTKG